MNKTLYEYFLRDNINLWKALFIEQQRNNTDRIKELLKQLNNNNRELELLKEVDCYE